MPRELKHVDKFITDHACPVCGAVGDWESIDHSMWESYSHDLCLNCGVEVTTDYALVRTGLAVVLPGQTEHTYDLVDQEAFRQKCITWDFNKGNPGTIKYESPAPVLEPVPAGSSGIPIPPAIDKKEAT